VEHTPTVLLSLARQANAKTCASLVIECGRKAESWSGTRHVSRLLRGCDIGLQSTKRRKQCSPVFTALAI
jgi:transposase